ncbi:hypothetical protein TGME49_261790 [Toxoplasma gondii ME49]|uniref:Transmembrane protein n=2 Tax=Toxoplasma gondii TaxID=5811 RepID=S8F4J1_TOXGM|nr:hypothetical protein TGME49_261790 [Toxoplasma gondii ME49]EPT29602.1 hypothetical protein TGME49_261790 [Toxoplasma gondii ME49]|eukprot:XP_018637109.1 hypothetical protein TGME49_261790 [Toxoplasma gondii ME49]
MDARTQTACNGGVGHGATVGVSPSSESFLPAGPAEGEGETAFSACASRHSPSSGVKARHPLCPRPSTRVKAEAGVESSSVSPEDLSLWEWLRERLHLCYASLVQRSPPSNNEATLFSDAIPTQDGRDSEDSLPPFLGSLRPPSSSFLSSDRSSFAPRTVWTEQTSTLKSLTERRRIAKSAVLPEAVLRWLWGLPETRRRNVLGVLKAMKAEEEAAVWAADRDAGESGGSGESEGETASAEKAVEERVGEKSGRRRGVDGEGDGLREAKTQGDRREEEVVCGEHTCQEEKDKVEEETQRVREQVDPRGPSEEIRSREALSPTTYKDSTETVAWRETSSRLSRSKNVESVSSSDLSFSPRAFFLLPPSTPARPGVPPALPAWSPDCAFAPASSCAHWPGAAGVWERAGVIPAFQLGELVMHSWQGRFQLGVVLERRLFACRRRRGARKSEASQPHTTALVSPVALREEEQRQRKGKRGGAGETEVEDCEEQPKRRRLQSALFTSSSEDSSESSEDESAATQFLRPREKTRCLSPCLSSGPAEPGARASRRQFEVIYRVVCLGYNKLATKKSFGEWTRENHLMVVDGLDVLQKCHAHNLRAIRDVKDAGFNAWSVQTETAFDHRCERFSSADEQEARNEKKKETVAVGGGRGAGRGRRGRGRTGDRTTSREGVSGKGEDVSPRRGRQTYRDAGRAGRRKPGEKASGAESDSQPAGGDEGGGATAGAMVSVKTDRERERRVKVESLRRKLLDDMEQLKQAEESRRQEETTGKENPADANRTRLEDCARKTAAEVHPLWKLSRWLFVRLSQSRSLVLLRSFPLMPHELRASREERGRRSSSSQVSPGLRLVGEMTVSELQARFEWAFLTFLNEKRRLEADAQESRSRGNTEIGVTCAAASTACRPERLSVSDTASSSLQAAGSSSQSSEEGHALAVAGLLREGENGAGSGDIDSWRQARGKEISKKADRKRQTCVGEEREKTRGSGDPMAPCLVEDKMQPGGQTDEFKATSGTDETADNASTGSQNVGNAAEVRGISGVSRTFPSAQVSPPTQEPTTSACASQSPVSMRETENSQVSSSDSSPSTPPEAEHCLEKGESSFVSSSFSFASSVSYSGSSFSSLLWWLLLLHIVTAVHGCSLFLAWICVIGYHRCVSVYLDLSVSVLKSASVPPALQPAPSPVGASSSSLFDGLSIGSGSAVLATSCLKAEVEGSDCQEAAKPPEASWDSEVELECEFFASYFGGLSASKLEALWGPLTSLVALQVDWLNSHFLAVACHTEEEAADLRDHMQRLQTRLLSDVVGVEHWVRCLHPAAMAKHHVQPVLENLPFPLQRQFVRLTQFTVHYLEHLWRRKIEESNGKRIK